MVVPCCHGAALSILDKSAAKWMGLRGVLWTIVEKKVTRSR